MAEKCPCCGRPKPELRGVTVSGRAGTVEARGQTAKLTPKEMKLLRLMMDGEGHTASFDDLRGSLWDGAARCQNSLSQHMYRLREKLVPLGLKINTRVGFGYRLQVDGRVGRKTRERMAKGERI